MKFSQNTMLLIAVVVLVLLYVYTVSTRSSYQAADMGMTSLGWAPSSMPAAPSSMPMPVAPSMPAAPSMPTPEEEEIVGADVTEDVGYASAGLMDSGINVGMPTCQMTNGVGLASSLLPRDVAQQENFGDFAPDDILAGQNFLDARGQIGFPETIGGNLRNGNRQIRADPPNPKSMYVWNNTTIVPDLMQRDLCA
jgi:hypothetical protein